MNVNDVYTGSQRLKAADLQRREHEVVIESAYLAELEEDDGRSKRLIELTFVGKEKTLLLNVTNKDAIAYAYGDETDGWIGKPIILYPHLVKFQGRQVEAIRVRVQLERVGAAPEPLDGRGGTGPAPTPEERQRAQAQAQGIATQDSDFGPQGADGAGFEDDDVPF